jgi:hypothetical protein
MPLAASIRCALRVPSAGRGGRSGSAREPRSCLRASLSRRIRPPTRRPTRRPPANARPKPKPPAVASTSRVETPPVTSAGVPRRRFALPCALHPPQSLGRSRAVPELCRRSRPCAASRQCARRPRRSSLRRRGPAVSSRGRRSRRHLSCPRPRPNGRWPAVLVLGTVLALVAAVVGSTFPLLRRSEGESAPVEPRAAARAHLRGRAARGGSLRDRVVPRLREVAVLRRARGTGAR